MKPTLLTQGAIITGDGVCGLGEYYEPPGICRPCSTGTYMDELIHEYTECNRCEPGTYAADEGMDYCDPCDAGEYAEDEGQRECVGCAPGTYASSMGMSECFLCPPGRYAPNYGSIACYLECPLGTYSGEGAAFCLDCDHAYYSPGGTDRIPCAPGTYSEKNAATCLIPCPTRWSGEKFDGYDSCLKSGMLH